MASVCSSARFYSCKRKHSIKIMVKVPKVFVSEGGFVHWPQNIWLMTSLKRENVWYTHWMCCVLPASGHGSSLIQHGRFHIDEAVCCKFKLISHFCFLILHTKNMLLFWSICCFTENGHELHLQWSKVFLDTFLKNFLTAAPKNDLKLLFYL